MFKRKKKKTEPDIVKPRILTWEDGRAWLRENRWILHIYETEYFKDEIIFTAEKSINGLKVGIRTEATSDLAGIKGLVELAQKYEIRER